MLIKRRTLLTGGVSLAALHLLNPALEAQNSVHPKSEAGLPPVPFDEPVEGPLFLKCGPMVGSLSHTEARLWVKASNAGKLSALVGSHPDLAKASEVDGPSLAAQTAFAGEIHLKDLQPATRYYYAILLDGKVVSPLPHGSFVTSPTPGTVGIQRFAFVSCAGYRGYMAAAAWGEMAARADFEMLLMLGDNHYANTSDLAKQRADYVMHRQVAGFRALTAHLPCYGIWDDHDFGPNDADGTLPGKQESLRAFKEFWANPAYGEEENPGCYFKFTCGDVEFFMLDVRYHRSPDAAPKDDAKTILGAKQLAWLKRGIETSTAKVKFIASGSTFESNGTADSWISYPAERRVLLDFLRPETGVVLLSGDRHFTGGFQVEGRWIEITTGPLGSGNVQAKPTRELFAVCSTGKMWSIMEVDTRGEEPKLAWEIWMAGAGRVERREFSWGEVNGTTKIPPSGPLPRS